VAERLADHSCPLAALLQRIKTLEGDVANWRSTAEKEQQKAKQLEEKVNSVVPKLMQERQTAAEETKRLAGELQADKTKLRTAEQSAKSAQARVEEIERQLTEGQARESKLKKDIDDKQTRIQVSIPILLDQPMLIANRARNWSLK